MRILNIFLSGAITMECIVIALFFFKYGRKTSDRFFLYFALAFNLLALERVVWLFFGLSGELRPSVYLFRLAAFILIIVAVLLKNRKSVG